ncbi:TonB-dependent receptor domain-containing protein [Congregibacter litoralis]|uniref:Outer membrane receptor protein, mostly Fe transport n=1 Tax=Congregibacter litoralis KT71 TaxID=314285 RepID=A4A7Y0_9GAMM|nr:TonB-dependent receptor [Congregibacter litoralis]EAQ97775.1 Outer membrane receptor protein, mostly Fe transport [Congregibacter litoralis KT71]
MTQVFGARRFLPVLLFLLCFTHPAKAADELLVYVFDQGAAVAGAAVAIDGEAVGVTRRDGSLFVDLPGSGQRVLTVTSADGAKQRDRFSSASGQLVDVIVNLGSGDNQSIVEVYSRTESTADRREVPTGELQITVRKGSDAAASQLVVISNGQGGVSTNAQGVATKTVPRGIYRVTTNGVSRSVRVVGGVTRGVQINLPEADAGFSIAAPQIEEVFVLGTFDASGFELSERDTNLIVDTLGVEELARFGDSDVAASVIRVPGVAVQDDKYVFIRGLGGRYVTSTLNNATMPSTNPTKRTVPLDLFPSNFVNQLDIKKTFLPFMPGESTGGNLVINTKTFPDERAGSITASLGYVTDLTGNTVAVDPADGTFDFIGWDDGSRKENILVSTIGDIVSDGGTFTDDEGNTFTLQQSVLRELQRSAGVLLSQDWDLDFSETTPNGGLGVNYGDLFYLGEGELGFYAAVNYSNEWSQRGNGIRRTYSASGIVADDQSYESYSQNIDISGLVSIGYNIGNNTFEWNNVMSRSTESFVERSVGREGDEFRSVYQATSQWEERQFFSTQIVGSHFLNEDGSIFGEWQFTGSQARRYVPGRTDVRFNAEANLTEPADLRAGYDFSSPNDEQGDLLNGFFFSSGSSSKRWDDLTDNNFDGSFDITWDLYDDGASFGQLRFGAQAIYRERDADSATYGYFNNGADATLSASPNVLVTDNIFVCGEGPGTVTCEDNTQGGVQDSPTTGFLFQVRTQVSDEYEAKLDYNSIYAMYDHTFDGVWEVIAGARYEQYEQVTDTFDLTTGNPVQGIVDEGSFLPALGINWFYSDTQQLRLAISQTVARPDFKEASNAVFFDNEFNVRVRGNPNLTVSDVFNADLRWEWYFGDNDTDNVSAAVFYKDMTDPIERVYQAASGTASNSRTFQNSEAAELYGFEVEGRKEFLLTDDYNNTLFVSFNAAYIESEVTLLSGDARALQGQPEYTANFVIGYDNVPGGHQLTLLYNHNGESIADVGILGLPNVLLEERGEMNLVYRYDISETASLKARIENIFDAEVEYTQGGEVFQFYEKGTTFQIGLDWEF